jgi:hypothetical protein
VFSLPNESADLTQYANFLAAFFGTEKTLIVVGIEALFSVSWKAHEKAYFRVFSVVTPFSHSITIYMCQFIDIHLDFNQYFC